MQGVVHPAANAYNDEILFELLTALEPYSDIVIDWRGIDKLKVWMTKRSGVGV